MSLGVWERKRIKRFRVNDTPERRRNKNPRDEETGSA